MPNRAKAPIELLQDLRTVFERDATSLREEQEQARVLGTKRVLGAKAAASENVVRQIDATLRDWA